MGCDIHLRVEIKHKESDRWRDAGFLGGFSSRIYGMFSALADVRSRGSKNLIPVRGIPDDIGYQVFGDYYKRIRSPEDTEDNEWSYSYKNAERWIADGLSERIERNGVEYCSDPDAHTPSWCTPEEMETCYKAVFYDNGELNPLSDYIEYLGLVSLMKSLASTGEYDVRAVFWFDN